MVSVVIPVYNVQDYLQETLESVQAQTYRNWECICVDDGSTDGSADIVRAFAERDARFRLVRQKNAGAAAARNTGLTYVRGEFMTFLDSDDLLRPGHFETCVTRLQEDDSDICAFHLAVLRKGEVVEDVLRVLPAAAGAHCCYEPLALRGRLFTSMMAGPCNKMYRTETVMKWKLDFPGHIKRCEDASFAVLSLAVARRISFVGRSFYIYRQEREGSQTSSMSRPEVCLGFVDSCQVSWDALKERGLLAAFGVDNILHMLAISRYYFTHMPDAAHTRQAKKRINAMVRDGMAELESMGALDAEGRLAIRQASRELDKRVRDLLFHFALRRMRLEKTYYACLHRLRRLLKRH